MKSLTYNLLKQAINGLYAISKIQTLPHFLDYNNLLLDFREDPNFEAIVNQEKFDLINKDTKIKLIL